MISRPLYFIEQNIILFALMGIPYFVVFFIADLHDYQIDFRYWNNIGRLVIAVVIATVVVIIIFYFPLGAFVGRTQLLLQAFIFAILVTLWRLSFSALALHHRLRRRLFIIGAGSAGRRLLEALRNRPRSGYEPLGFVDDDPPKMGATIDGLPVLGNSQQLPELITEHRVELVVVAVTHYKTPLLINSLVKVSWQGACLVMDMPGFYEMLAGKIPIDHISDLWVYLRGLQTNRLYTRHFKRLFDLFLTAVTLLLSAPLMAIIALAIKLDSRGPVFFRQERLGLEGRPFPILKFRTMVSDAEANGPQFAEADDPRITRVGRVLRKFRLDELPQLFNIFKGEMSFVGPRPEREVFIQQFQEATPEFRPGRRATDPPGSMVICGYKESIPFYSYRLVVKPGITGWAQVMYPYAASSEETSEKLKYDLFYIKNVGFFLDLAILLKTVRVVLFGRGT